jgi:hypothetical protein
LAQVARRADLWSDSIINVGKSISNRLYRLVQNASYNELSSFKPKLRAIEIPTFAITALRIDATSRRMTLHVISMRNPAMRLE